MTQRRKIGERVTIDHEYWGEVSGTIIDDYNGRYELEFTFCGRTETATFAEHQIIG
ncbi:MAG: hypothetical protein LPK02_07075 [Rhodobacterales bacterium]|mgnify:CR=1 FL=1|nr:hypothetical protein [Rhodobacterales bacterium]